MPGSTCKTCPSCKTILPCAKKICSHCKMVQPVKERLKIALRKCEAKREEWASSRKKNHNMDVIKQEMVLLLEKLQAAGYKSVLLLGKATKKSHVVKVFTPRCTLATFAEESLKKLGSIHEYICQGWTPFASGTAEGPEEGRGTTQMDMDMGEVEDRAVQVEEEAVEEVALQVEEVALQVEEVALQLEEVALQLEEVALQVEEVALQVEEVEEVALQVEEGALQVEEGALQVEEGALQVEEVALQVEEGALQVEEGALQVEEVAHPDTEGPAVSTVQRKRRSKEHHSQKGLEKRNKTLPKSKMK
ncbi:unnamed protein product [Arctogadus glacialis]